MAKFQMGPIISERAPDTARLGAGTGAGNNWTDADNSKLVKLVADSRYDLCAAGDQIEAAVVAIESATLDGYTVGSVTKGGSLSVTLDGIQATPGTGTVAVGDFVVAGTIAVKGTAVGAFGPKVCKATTQTGMYFVWRVVALPGASGAVGQPAVIQRVG